MKIGYARVSTLHEEQLSSIENQVERLKEYGCERVFIDRLTGGTLDRPGWKELKSFLSRVPRIDEVKIILTSPERLGRNRDQIMAQLEELEDLGVEIWAMSDPISIKTSSGRLRWGVFFEFAEFSKRQTQEKVQKIKERHRQQKRKMGGVCVFGYAWNLEKSQRIPHPTNWAIARELVQRIIEGKQGWPGLSKWLRETHGVKRSASGLKTWVKNPVLRGHTAHRIVKRKKKKLVFYNTHKPLITVGEWKAIKIRLQTNKACSGNRKIRAMQGIARCAECRNLLSYSSDGRPRKDGSIYVYYRCKAGRNYAKPCPLKSSIPQPRLLAAAKEAVMGVARGLAKAVLTPDEELPDSAVLTQEAYVTELEELLNRFPTEQLQETLKAAKAELHRLKNSTDQRMVETARVEELTKAFADPAYWDCLSDSQLNSVLKEIGLVCWVKGKQIVRCELR